MVNTYTTKLGLAKPANGDVDWHIPINGNWDELDSKLGPLYEDITSDTTKLTVKKDVDMSAKNINNVNMLTVNKIKATSYLWTTDPGLLKPRYTDNTVCSNGTTPWVTVKTVPTVKVGVSGSATFYYNFYSTNNNYPPLIRLIRNGVEVSGSISSAGNYTITETVSSPIAENDVFALQIKGNNNYTGYNNVFGIYALMVPIVDESETWT